MAETGESYTVARTHFDAPPKKTTATAKSMTVAAFKKQTYGRQRVDDLAGHLEKHYDIRVSQMTELDVGVYRVDRTGEPSWIARLFPAARSVDSAQGDAEVLNHLEQQGFPAERAAHTEPVSVFAGQPVLVTSYVEGSNRRNGATESMMKSLGSMLGRLHALPDGPDACARPAGSW